ncbi:lysylphosphatidylglycerol synthase transmembrane domain-containing protein [Aldersonia kunmingensis]|uniref:lysylphosphatidylglycerol synthase transmembrane domain-containing protein n=1 Tax=Aldersonia kunmingensis TaxID=408066 RepID=UPI000832CE14|nr:YbhN family protein [Aldersonia kunmingensis]
MGQRETESSPTVRIRQRSRFWWAKWAAGFALLALLAGEGVYLWPRLHESWRALTEIHWGWLALCVFAQAVSLSSYGRMQKQLLHAGGVEVTQRTSDSVIYASTAMSVTLPAGQVFSTAFSYRAFRRWGASPVVASWELAISGVIAAAGLALIGMCGALLVGSSVNPAMLIASVGAVIALVWAGHYASNNPRSLESAARWAVARYNRMRKKAANEGMDKVREVIAQVESVDLGTKDGLLTALWAFGHRFGDIACLAAACYAVGADPRLSGLLITYAVGKAVGTIPFAPGGLVLVDATLIATLTSTAGLTAPQAIASAFVYRGVSFILVAIVGWIVFLILYRRKQHEDLEYDLEMEQAEARELRRQSES